MIPSIDLTALLIAVALIALTFSVAARTRSRTMRVVLVGIAAVVIGLMLWNLAVHGGFHAV